MKAFLKKLVSRDLATKNSSILDGVNKNTKKISSTLSRIDDSMGMESSIPRSVRLNLDTTRLMAVEPIYTELRRFYARYCMDFEETMDTLGQQDVSMARFGDGEFKVMLRVDGNHKFQDVTPGIQIELKRTLAVDSSTNCVIGLPYLFNNPFWSNIWANYYPEMKSLLSSETRYACAHVTRPVYFRVWQMTAVQKWRKVWDGMNAVVVTGEEAKFDLIPELFDTLNSAEFVRGPNTNAYFEIDDLERRAIEAGADVVLISLGPAGTVLAQRLARVGIHALDIGHISASYKNVFHGDKRPEEL